MGRLIQEKIKQPLAEELLFGKLVHGGERQGPGQKQGWRQAEGTQTDGLALDTRSK
jgi:ATP-dependent Clp protease ATP-binding subunit ClpA